MSTLRVRGAHPTVVEYAPALLDEVRSYVSAGFGGSVHGRETGGVLFGKRTGRTITVTAMRPVALGHSQGPEFLPGPDDAAEFRRTLDMHRTDEVLAGTEPVGWFLSHARDSLVLRKTDREIFDRYLPEPWHIALVIRPGSVGSLRAATIVRSPEEGDGVVLNSFSIRQLRDGPQTPPSESVVWIPDAPVMSVKVIPKAAAPQPSTALEPLARCALEPLKPAPPPAHEPSRPTRRSRWWQPALAVAGVSAVALAGFLYLRANEVDTIGLEAYQKDGVLRIEWNPSSHSVERASTAKLEISDGDSVTVRDLAKDDLKRGLWAVLCRRSDCTAKLFLYDGNGYIKEEMARYAGHRPALSDPSEEVRRLEREKAVLQDQLEQERTRANELAGRLRALEKR